MWFLLYTWRAAGLVEKVALVASLCSPFALVLAWGAYGVDDQMIRLGALLVLGLTMICVTLAIYFMRAVWWRLRLGPPGAADDE